MASRVYRWRTWADVGLLSTFLLVSGMFVGATFGSVGETLASMGIPSAYLARGLFATAVISLFVAMGLLTAGADD